MLKFFKFPFAAQGDKVVVPDGVQADGSVSYEQGFGYDYARNLANDPLAKPMPRDKTNQIFNDITQAIREYQTLGTPDFITPELNDDKPYPYAMYARVRYNGSVYVSRKDNNTSLPAVASDWDEVTGTKATNAEAIAGLDDSKIMTPAKVKLAVQTFAPPSIIRITAGQSLPTTNIGPIWHDDYAAVMTFRTIGSYTGYASVNLGAVEYFDSDTAPAGWLKINGATLTNSYAALIASRGSATLPDARSMFIRGLDDGRGVDSGRTRGSLQSSALGAHSHTASVSDPGHGHSVYDPTHSHHQQTPREFQGNIFTDASGQDTWEGYGFFGDYTAGAPTGIGIYGNGTGISVSIGSTGSAETRPANLAFLACIKF